MRPFSQHTFLRANFRELARSVQALPPRSQRSFSSNNHFTSSKPSTPLISRLRARPAHLQRPLRRHAQSRAQSSKQKPKDAPSPNVTPNLGSPEPALSISQRMRKLSREYGWSAVGVYFALSALDFPFCFLAVRMLGTDRIGHWEHVVVGYVWRLFTLDGRVGQVAQTTEEGAAETGKMVEDGNARGGVVAVAQEGSDAVAEASEGKGWNWGVEAADEANSKSDATIWTQLALAYAIHKSFIFLRVPATVAVTPKIVKTLRGWGWNVGKMPKRASKTG